MISFVLSMSIYHEFLKIFGSPNLDIISICFWFKFPYEITDMLSNLIFNLPCPRKFHLQLKLDKSNKQSTVRKKQFLQKIFLIDVHEVY